MQALDHVDFTLHTGEIHGLLGENGAGKSTLIKVLTGVFARDGGTIRLDGRDIAPRSGRRAPLGIGTVYQEVNLLPNLSVAENLFIGRQPHRFGLVRLARCAAARELLGGLWSRYRRRHARWAAIRWPSSRSSPSRARRSLGQGAHPRRADRQPRRARSRDAFDDHAGSEERRHRHRLRHPLPRPGLCDLRPDHRPAQRRLVGEYARFPNCRGTSLSDDAGRELAAEALTATSARPPTGERPSPSRITANAAVVEPFDLAVRPGEVVGLAGLLGSGRTETAQLLFGIERADRAGVVDGKPVRCRRAARCGAPGLRLHARGPQDRRHRRELSVRENIILALQARRGGCSRVQTRKQDEIADRFIKLSTFARPSGEADRPSLRRQSAEGAARPLAGDRAALPHPRRAHPRHRRRRPCRDHPPDRATLRRRDALLVISSELEEIAPTATGSSCCATGGRCAN